MKQIKTTDKNPSGTSFYGNTFTATVDELTTHLGEPMLYGDVEDKSQNEWVCETADGVLFTIYDWKQYRMYRTDEPIEWHIGAHNASSANDAHAAVVNTLENL
jgi:hypothetical protein